MADSSDCQARLKMEPPSTTLETMARDRKLDMDSIDFAKHMDDCDELKHLRSMFWYPKMRDLPFGKTRRCSPYPQDTPFPYLAVDFKSVNADDDAVYFCGHSLGLQPKGVEKYMQRELDKWAKM